MNVYNNNPVKIVVDNTLLYSSKNTLSNTEYFQQLFEKYPNKEEYFIDVDLNVFQHILEYLRNGDCYVNLFPREYIPILNDFIEGNNLINYDNVVELNIGGTLFRSTKETLSKCIYFDNIFSGKFREEVPKFIDRNPEGFKYILSYLRGCIKNIPKKYECDINYFGIMNEKNKVNRSPKRNKMEEVNLDGQSKDVGINGFINNSQLTSGRTSTYLYANPSITYMIKHYQRHTFFYIDNSYKDGEFNDKAEFIIEKKDINGGDIVYEPYLYLDLREDKIQMNEKYELINKVELYVDNLLHDTLTGELLYLIDKVFFNKVKDEDNTTIGLYFYLFDKCCGLHLLKNTKIKFIIYLNKNYGNIKISLRYNIVILDEAQKGRMNMAPREQLVQQHLYRNYEFDNYGKGQIFKLDFYQDISTLIFTIENHNNTFGEYIDEIGEDHLVDAYIYYKNSLIKKIDLVDCLIMRNKFNFNKRGVYVVNYSVKKIDITDIKPTGSVFYGKDTYMMIKTNIPNGNIKIYAFSYNILKRNKDEMKLLWDTSVQHNTSPEENT